MPARSSRLRLIFVVAACALLTSGLLGCTQQVATQPTATVTVTVTPTPSVTASPTAPQPVLASVNAFGSPDGVEGFGTVEPSHIYQGGDPTGDVANITWDNWGSPTAIGFGTACYVGPGEDVAHCTLMAAEVIASNLGTCDGQPAYEDVGWFFPGVEGDANSAEGSDVAGCLYAAGD